MQSSRRGLLALLIAMGAAACGDSAVTPPADLLLTTDSSSYTALSSGGGAVAVKVVMRYRNRTNAPISLDRCFSSSPHPMFNVELISPQNAEGAAYAMAVCLEVGTPIVVAAGDTRTDTLVIHGPNSFDGRTGRSLGVMEGSFRIVYGGQRSNEFHVALPPEGVVPAVPRDLSTAILTDSQLVHMTFKAPLFAVTAPVRFTIYNPRPDTSFIVNCGGLTSLYLEKQTGTQWVMAWSPPIPLCLSSAIVIPPGGRYETAIDVYGVPVGVNAAPTFLVAVIPGVYRLVWTNIVNSRTGGTAIPIEYRRSNAFAIVVDP